MLPDCRDLFDADSLLSCAFLGRDRPSASSRCSARLSERSICGGKGGCREVVGPVNSSSVLSSSSASAHDSVRSACLRLVRRDMSELSCYLRVASTPLDGVPDCQRLLLLVQYGYYCYVSADHCFNDKVYEGVS